MTKKQTHADAITGHVFVLGFFFLGSIGALLLGLFGLNYVLPAGLGNPIWVWAFIVVGILGILVFPIIMIRDWPAKPDKETA